MTETTFYEQSNIKTETIEEIQPPAKWRKKVTKPQLISFRITALTEERLSTLFKIKPIVGIKSIDQLCRKIVMDFLSGRLVYKNIEDASKNYDI